MENESWVTYPYTPERGLIILTLDLDEQNRITTRFYITQPIEINVDRGLWRDGKNSGRLGCHCLTPEITWKSHPEIGSVIGVFANKMDDLRNLHATIVFIERIGATTPSDNEIRLKRLAENPGAHIITRFSDNCPSGAPQEMTAGNAPYAMITVGLLHDTGNEIEIFRGSKYQGSK